jgi:hypothetical protein
MRTWILAALFAVAAAQSQAFAQAAAGAKPGPSARPASGPAAGNPPGVNADARRLEEERYRRWNDRMRRATRSLCDRC